jgi:hypothetical protein
MYYAQNYIDPIRTGSQNLEGLYRANQKQHECSKQGGRRGIKRILREAQCDDLNSNQVSQLEKRKSIAYDFLTEFALSNQIPVQRLRV